MPIKQLPQVKGAHLTIQDKAKTNILCAPCIFIWSLLNIIDTESLSCIVIICIIPQDPPVFILYALGNNPQTVLLHMMEKIL